MGAAPTGGGRLVSLGEAERLCCRGLGMTPAAFRHELAEHVRGRGGIPWIATETEAGVYRSVLDALLDAAPASTKEKTDE